MLNKFEAIDLKELLIKQNKMKKLIERLKEDIEDCSDRYAENRNEIQKALNTLQEIEKLIK